MTDLPQTRASLATDLAALGLRHGDTVLLHASLRSLGWVCGGAVAVVQALLDALGPDGTLVVTTQTAENSDPATWRNPPVPESWWPVIREHTPAFDPRITPSQGIGALAETVRTWPGAVRSDHPQTSFAAVGAAAAELMAEHDLDSHFGERSPLAAIERRDGVGLLLGVGFGVCTAFHLAEYRQPAPPTTEFAAVVRTAHGRRWVTGTTVAAASEDFADIGVALTRTDIVTQGTVGAAASALFPIPAAVEFATGWMRTHRAASPAPG